MSTTVKCIIKNKLNRQLTVDKNANPAPSDIIIIPPLSIRYTLLKDEELTFIRKGVFGKNLIIRKT